MKSLALLGAVALISSSAGAAFTGWTTEVTTVSGRNIYKVYANFNAVGAGVDGSSQRILNVFDFGKADTTPEGNQIAAGRLGAMGAVHNDNLVGDLDTDGDFIPDVIGSKGSWGASPSDMNASQSLTDSFVLLAPGASAGIGLSWGTNFDPGFMVTYGATADDIKGPENVNAGWNDASPGSPILIGATYKVRVMQIARIAADDNNLFTANMTCGYAYLGAGVAQFGYGSFTIGAPAPGAIALVGLAGLVGRRRRA